MESRPLGVYVICAPHSMACSVLARRLRGGTSCYVPSKTERSRSNLRSFVYKRACRLTSLAYHASACILLRIDYIQHFVLIPYRRQAADFIHGFAVILRVAFLSYEAKIPHTHVCGIFLFQVNYTIKCNTLKKKEHSYWILCYNEVTTQTLNIRRINMSYHHFTIEERCCLREF